MGCQGLSETLDRRSYGGKCVAADSQPHVYQGWYISVLM